MNGSLSLKLFKFHIPNTILDNFSLLIPIQTHSTTTNHHFSYQHPLSSLQCGAILQSLTDTKSFSQGQQLHAHVISCGTLQDNTYLCTKLAAFYSNCSHMAEAEAIFNRIVLKNVFLWNSVIRGYARDGCPIKSLVLYREMLSFGQRPDNFTYPFVLKACGDLGVIEIGSRVHCDVVVRGFELDVYVGNSLLSMYSKFGDVEMMGILFDRMPERDLTSWNTVISAYVKNGNVRQAVFIFHMMEKAGVIPDCSTLLGVLSACVDLGALKHGKTTHAYIMRKHLEKMNNSLTNSLIEMYCACDSMMEARRVFNRVLRKDVVSWNSMIWGYSRSGDAFESLRLFHQMILDGIWPDQVTAVAVLGACHQIMALRFGMSIHAYTVKHGLSRNVFVGTALVDMYSKCGSLACSGRVFRDMLEKNLVSWSAMIAGYGFHGRGREAISVFEHMKEKDIAPDEGVFTSLLSACSHAGLVDEGKRIFDSMKNEYRIMPGLAQYSCLVDLLGRAGCLDEAYNLIKKMEVTPSSDIWSALLSAAQLHQHVELAELSAQKVLDMEPKGIVGYICLSNAYAAENRWDDVERLRAVVRMKGLEKEPGCSYSELNKEVHRFLDGDWSCQ